MYLDALLQLASSQAATASAYTTNTIDLGNVTPKRDIGNGEPMALVFTIEVAADFTTTDETYEFLAVDSANANLSSHREIASRVILAAELTVGSKVVLPIGKGAITNRYFGGRVVLAGTTPSVTFSATVMPMAAVEQYKAMQSGFTVS